MDPLILTSALATNITSSAVVALRDAVIQRLARNNVEVSITGISKVDLVKEISKNADVIRGDESPEQASRETRYVIETQITILEKERTRLMPIAAREHIVALTFAILAGAVFLCSIVLVFWGTGQQAIITLMASVLPGFLSKIFFSREDKIENRLKETVQDLRGSEKTKEKLLIMEEALRIVPDSNKKELAKKITDALF